MADNSAEARINVGVTSKDTALQELQDRFAALQREMKETAREAKQTAKAMDDGAKEAAAGVEALNQKFTQLATGSLAGLGGIIAGAFSLDAIRQFVAGVEDARRKLADDEGKDRERLAQLLNPTGDTSRGAAA